MKSFLAPILPLADSPVRSYEEAIASLKEATALQLSEFPLSVAVTRL